MPQIHVVKDSYEALRQVNSDGGKNVTSAAQHVAEQVGFGYREHVDASWQVLSASVAPDDVVIFSSNTLRHPESRLRRELQDDPKFLDCNVLVLHQYAEMSLPILASPTLRKFPTSATATVNLGVHPALIAPYTWSQDDFRTESEGLISWMTVDFPLDQGWDVLVRCGNEVLVAARDGTTQRSAISCVPLDWYDAQGPLRGIIHWLATGPLSVVRLGESRGASRAVTEWDAEQIWTADRVNADFNLALAACGPRVVVAGENYCAERLGNLRDLGITTWQWSVDKAAFLVANRSVSSYLAAELVRALLADTREARHLIAHPSESLHSVVNLLAARASLRDEPLVQSLSSYLSLDSLELSGYQGITHSSRMALEAAQALLSAEDSEDAVLKDPQSDSAEGSGPEERDEIATIRQLNFRALKAMALGNVSNSLDPDRRFQSVDSISQALGVTDPNPELLAVALRIDPSPKDRSLARALRMLEDPEVAFTSKAALVSALALHRGKDSLEELVNSPAASLRVAFIDSSLADQQLIEDNRVLVNRLEVWRRTRTLGAVVAWLLSAMVVLMVGIAAVAFTARQPDLASVSGAVVAVSTAVLLSLSVIRWFGLISDGTVDTIRRRLRSLRLNG